MYDKVGPTGTGDVPMAVSAVPPDASGELAAIGGRVVRWYAALAAGWIVLSDLAVAGVEQASLGEQAVDVGKGLVFVAVSAAILWFVLRRLTRAFDRMFARTVTEQRDFYDAVLRNSSDVVLFFDHDGVVRYANEATTRVLGWEVEEVLGRSGQDLLHPNDLMAATSFRENAAQGRWARRTFRMVCRDGSYRALEVTGSSVDLGGHASAVINGRDVTERTQSEQQLRAALAEDVTGLPSLRMFEAEMERLSTISIAGLAAVVVLVDIDKFGDVNALHGRAGGDTVLFELTRRLEAAVPEAIGLWRHGADEILAVLLDGPPVGTSGPDVDAVELVDRIQREAAAPMAFDGGSRRISIAVSVGVTRVALDGSSRPEPLSTRMLYAVERALAEAKGHPDRTALHPDEADWGGANPARMGAEVRDALEQGQLVAHYQPRVRLDDLAVVGAEALVRWEHPTQGLLAPGLFLPTVEASNLSAALTRSVLRDALAMVPQWLASSECDESFVVAVNISLDDLRRRRFVQDVFDALDESGVDAHRLCLELTEQTMLADTLGARQVVDELRRAGIGVAIDDFGTGYSSLEHIRVFEVDELKIDKGFVQRIGQSRADEAIIDSVLAIGHRLDLKVTAEGIESDEALEYLRARGCDSGQGYLFSPAVPGPAFPSTSSWAALS